MDVIYERCCGLDVHKKTVVASIITPEGRELRTFTTMAKDLLAMADWLLDHKVTHVAMESTGVYWKPIFNLLEELDVTVVGMYRPWKTNNRSHLAGPPTVPTRKSRSSVSSR
jgi:transposase